MSEVAVQSDFSGAFGVLEREGCLLLVANRRQLVPGGPAERVFDLPGGRVEAGETLAETLVREWREECALLVTPAAFLFVQEGVRRVSGQRRYTWRSFFFRVRCEGEPRPTGEVEAVLWCPRDRLQRVLGAPYHKGFLRWLSDAEAFQQDEWS